MQTSGPGRAVVDEVDGVLDFGEGHIKNAQGRGGNDFSRPWVLTWLSRKRPGEKEMLPDKIRPGQHPAINLGGGGYQGHVPGLFGDCHPDFPGDGRAQLL